MKRAPKFESFPVAFWNTCGKSYITLAQLKFDSFLVEHLQLIDAFGCISTVLFHCMYTWFLSIERQRPPLASNVSHQNLTYCNYLKFFLLFNKKYVSPLSEGFVAHDVSSVSSPLQCKHCLKIDSFSRLKPFSNKPSTPIKIDHRCA